MKIVSPLPDTVFVITSGAAWPSIPLKTDGIGAHLWTWTIAWETFPPQSGTASTPSNEWDAQTAVADLGGTLTITVKAGLETATVSITVKGTNPSATEASLFLATLAGSAGFDKILLQESKFQHFNAVCEPIKSFDNGYGMCQLTAPAPTHQQVWNWKSNVEGGLALFAAKRAAALAYLTQRKRTATEDQIKYEAVCRWNGGTYHTWDVKAGWVRNPSMLCDPKTGNMGWDMTDKENKGKSATDLHKRDSAAFKHAPTQDAHWKYSGVCYADHVLG